MSKSIIIDKPKVAGQSPEMVNAKPLRGVPVANQEISLGANGAHKGSVLNPNVFQAEESKAAATYLCKQTKNSPYCDGSHKNL